MLQSMRKHARYFYVLFLIVIITFVFWGVGTKEKSSTVAVAEIGDEKITVNDFRDSYDRAMEYYRQMYKDQSPNEIEKKLNLQHMVLDKLLEDKVLLISARELGLTVSDEELQKAIVTDPRFMRDGVFRKDIYQRVLIMNRLTMEAYESMMREQLAISKMRMMIVSSVDLTDADLAGAKVDEAKGDMLKQVVLYSKRNAALKSFVEGAKARMELKINKDIIS